MRPLVTLVFLVAVSSPLPAQQPASLDLRYGIEVALDAYPQGSPQETTAGVLKAVTGRRIDYLLAHLADPAYVDTRVQSVHHGRFSSLVDETAAYYASDPGVIKLWRRFLDEGTWDVQETTASARLKDTPRQLIFRRIGRRWFLENADRATSKP